MTSIRRKIDWGLILLGVGLDVNGGMEVDMRGKGNLDIVGGLLEDGISKEKKKRMMKV
jgi:hypothetical protein